MRGDAWRLRADHRVPAVEVVDSRKIEGIGHRAADSKKIAALCNVYALEFVRLLSAHCCTK